VSGGEGGAMERRTWFKINENSSLPSGTTSQLIGTSTIFGSVSFALKVTCLLTVVKSQF
jgi:hypothetical protein